MIIPQERNWPSWALALPKLENFIVSCPNWARSRSPPFPEGKGYEGWFPKIRRVVVLRMCEGASYEQPGGDEPESEGSNESDRGDSRDEQSDEQPELEDIDRRLDSGVFITIC